LPPAKHLFLRSGPRCFRTNRLQQAPLSACPRLATGREVSEMAHEPARFLQCVLAVVAAARECASTWRARRIDEASRRLRSDRGIGRLLLHACSLLLTQQSVANPTLTGPMVPSKKRDLEGSAHRSSESMASFRVGSEPISLRTRSARRFHPAPVRIAEPRTRLAETFRLAPRADAGLVFRRNWSSHGCARG